MEANPPQFPKFDKSAVEAEVRQRSAEYAESQPKDVNQGYMHSGVNQFLRGSAPAVPEPDTSGSRFVYTGPKDPYKI